VGIRRWRVKQLVKQEEKKKGKEEEEKEGREERKFKRNMSELVLSDIYVCCCFFDGSWNFCSQIWLEQMCAKID